MKPNRYYKISEAAKFLGVCALTLRNWDASGKLKARRIAKNGYRIYSQQDLLEFLKQVQDSAGTEAAVRKGLDEARQGKIVKNAIELGEDDGN